MPASCATPARETSDTCRGGPRTEAGRAVSSQNAIKSGLFTDGDFIRPGEEEAYGELTDGLFRELNPKGTLEFILFDEIRRASWRLARCGKVESNLVLLLNDGPVILDPMETLSVHAEKVQRSVDRARAQANRLRKQAMSELRKLQTERTAAVELLPEGYDVLSDGLIDRREVVRTLAEERKLTLLARKSGAEKPETDKPKTDKPKADKPTADTVIDDLIRSAQADVQGARQAARPPDLMQAA
jgi:predicted  nucleic acid-binding Zn-ribbon protein